MVEQSIAELLRQALRSLTRDVPSCHSRTCEALVGVAIRCDIDSESFRVARTADEPTGDAIVDVATSRATILALIHGRTNLLAALRSGALHVRGPVSHVERLSRAMTAFLHGAARSPAFPALLARLEESAPESP